MLKTIPQHDSDEKCQEQGTCHAMFSKGMRSRGQVLATIHFV